MCFTCPAYLIVLGIYVYVYLKVQRMPPLCCSTNEEWRGKSVHVGVTSQIRTADTQHPVQLLLTSESIPYRNKKNCLVRSSMFSRRRIEVVVLWFVAPYSFVVGNQRFGGHAVDTSPWSRTTTRKMEAARPPNRWFPTLEQYAATTQKTGASNEGTACLRLIYENLINKYTRCPTSGPIAASLFHHFDNKPNSKEFLYFALSQCCFNELHGPESSLRGCSFAS
jgi:hypothetical protein